MIISVANTFVRKGSLADPAIALLGDGNTFERYLQTDLTSITKNGANIVSRWNGQYGLNGADFINGSCLYTADGMQFNGIDQTLYTGVIVYPQPIVCYAVIKHITWIADGQMISGVGDVKNLGDVGVTPRVGGYGGQAFGFNNNMVVDTWYIVRSALIGANSFIEVGSVKSATSDSLGSVSMGRIYLGSYNAIGLYANCCIKDLIFRTKLDSDADDTIIKNHLKALYPSFSL